MKKTEVREQTSWDVAHSNREVLPITLENPQENPELRYEQDTTEALPDEH